MTKLKTKFVYVWIINYYLMQSELLKNKDFKHDARIINSEDTYSVRHPVLRAGKPIESCIFEGDELETTIHLGLFLNDKLIGVSTFLKKNNSLLSDSGQYQLRGMAILKEFQGYGFGKIILEHGELILKNKKVKTIWCNAREVAVNFYKKTGYQTIGKPFDIKDIGKHFIMYKHP
tara:strand:+ start:1067 stop:1591 length:525 start_codon:yes stop_codon:yes gene_type:complete